MSVQDYLDEQQGKWAEETAVRYTKILLRFEKEVDLERLSASSLRAWIHSHGWGNSQRCLSLVAVKGYLRWAYGSKHPALEISEKRAKPAPQRALKIPQIKQLISSFNTMETKGIRDLAICTLMLDTGLRASEVCRLELRYLDMDERQLQVIVKGGRWAKAMFSESTKRFLADESDRWESYDRLDHDVIVGPIVDHHDGSRQSRLRRDRGQSLYQERTWVACGDDDADVGHVTLRRAILR